MAGDDITIGPEAKPPPPKVFNCPGCGAGITIRAQGHTVAVTCRACGSLVDAADENHQILSKAQKNLKIDPLIPLGQRGKLHGTVWEVIGFMQRCDKSQIYCWSEYLLFNPTRGFRWLMEFDGHWNYIAQIKGKPVAARHHRFQGAMKYLDKTYYLFHRGSAKVTYVVGEFYWRIRVGELAKVEDYILPPELLSCEKTKDEIIWSLGEYIEADTVKDAFQITQPLPRQTGVAPNQPSTVSTVSPVVGKYWLYFMGIVIALQCLALISAKNEEAYQGSFAFHSNDPYPNKVTPAFELKHGTTNVRVTLQSQIQNGWLELGVGLVNDQTGQTREFEQGLEYYSGYDPSDGHWAEGNKTNNVVLSSIPEGTYHLNLRASGAVSLNSDAEQPYGIIVTRDVATWSNLMFALLLLSIVPAIVWWRSRKFEHARWSTSDFSPHWSQGD